MIGLLLITSALAGGLEDGRSHLQRYEQCDREAIWRGATPDFRQSRCSGEWEQCPCLTTRGPGPTDLGTLVRETYSCRRTDYCTYARFADYPTPPLPRSQTTRLEWRAVMTGEGRLKNIEWNYKEPGAELRTLQRVAGVLAATAGTAFVVALLLFGLLRIGRPRPAAPS